MKNTSDSVSNAAFAVPASRGRISQWLLLSTTVLTISASGAVTDLPATLSSVLDTAVGAGNSGRLVVNTKLWYGATTSTSNIDLNGYQLEGDTGGGNGQTYNGTFTGPGTFLLKGNATAPSNWNDFTFGGTSSNTPDSVVITQGRVHMNKTPGLNALGSGTITATVPNGNTARLIWRANNQVADTSTITSATSVGTGKLIVEIRSFSDTIDNLILKSGSVVETTTSDGVLTTKYLTVNGVSYWPGTYTSADGFITGPGSVVVTGGIVDLEGDPLPSDLNTYVGNYNTGRLIGYTRTWWSGGTFLHPIQLNGFEFHIANGGGNAQYYNGQISGPGTLSYSGSQNGTYSPPELSLGGSQSNTPDNVVLHNGRLQLNKTPGKDALAGPITVDPASGYTVRLQWMANHQINDASTIDSTTGAGDLVLELGDFQESIKGLTIKDGDTIDTGTSGILSLSNLIVDGTPLGAGTYTSAEDFITGTGSVIVTAVPDAANSTVTVSPGSVIADGSTTATVTVTLLDENGTPVENKSVSLVSNRGAQDTISAASGLSDASGVVTFTVKSLTEGDATFTALVVADDVTVTQTASVTFTFNPYTDISNTLTPVGAPADGVRIDAAVPVGKIGRLVGPVLTHWNSGSNFTRTVELNGYKLSIDSGSGNAMTVTGTIIGNGEVEFRGGGAAILNIGGATGNTYTGITTVTRGPVRLQKTSGNVINGTVTVNGPMGTLNQPGNPIAFPASGVLAWAASNQVNDASNFTLQQGSFQLDGYSETMGTAALTGDFTIKLGVATTSQLHFANSSAVAWTTGKVLTITEWDGSATGGGTEGIFFGNSAAGLTTDQLAQIQFVNPAGFDAGTYGAQILVSGEVVPYIAPPASTFASWATDNAGDQTAEQDYDGDGVQNGVEYFMGETGSTFTATPQVVTDGNVRTITWPRNLEAAASFKVQISEDLEVWTDIEAPDASIDESDADQVVYTLPEGSEKLFVRLVVTPLE